MTRTCLKCSKPFESEGNWNRICKPCDTANAKVPVARERPIHIDRNARSTDWTDMREGYAALGVYL